MSQNVGDNVTILGGDFNCTLNAKYDRASQFEYHKPSAEMLRNIVLELRLTDCYRHFNPTTRDYTWHNVRSFARLDRIYVSTFLKSHLQYIASSPCPLSDHHAVNAIFSLPSTVTKKSYWQLNVSILEDTEYLQIIQQFWEFWSEEKGSFSSLVIWWDIGKCKIKLLTQQY